MNHDLAAIETEIRACELCRGDMARAPHPILQVSAGAKILIASQAPGNRADLSGKPFDDPSGDRLRAWLGLDAAQFYDAAKVVIVPMGFCFPGYDKHGGDLPPMKRCAPTWRPRLVPLLTQVKLTVLVGSYAQKWHLGARAGKTLTATVANWRDYISEGMFTTPHPSWRNTGWLNRNPWFEAEALPVLQERVRGLLS